jgi:hypothetical protein
MLTPEKSMRGFFKVIVWIGLLLPAVAQKQVAAPQAPPVIWRAPGVANPDLYTGMELCAACHAAEAQQFAKTVHAKAAPASAKYGTGCESCHGPGKAHVEAMADAGGDAKKVSAAKKLIFSFQAKPAEKATRCLTCHNSSSDQRVFDRSEHQMMGVSCEQCHAPHLMGAPQTQTQFAQAKFFQAPEGPRKAAGCGRAC